MGTNKQVRERREKIRILLARGYSQGDIMDELGITTKTYDIDMEVINEMSRRQFYDIVKSGPLAAAYSGCVDDLDRIMKEC
jgi:hypothetical protein